MFTTIMHLSINAAMQRSVDAPNGLPAKDMSRKAVSAEPSPTVPRGPRRPRATPRILADTLRIAAGFY